MNGTSSPDSQAAGARVNPWYREPWPWIVMAAPAAAVVAGAVMVWLAMSTADGLVADDYYKRGLAINQDLARDRAVAQRGITATVEARGGKLRVRLEGDAAPPALFAHLVHPTRSGLDQRLRLAPSGPRTYEAELPELAAGRWRVILEDPKREWRIVKEGL